MQSAQKLRQYLSDADQSIRETDSRFRTGDSAVDSLLNMEYYSAVSRVPDLRFDTEEVLVPGSMQISSFDLCLIPGNALDNAIETCERLYRANRKREAESGVFTLWISLQNCQPDI